MAIWILRTIWATNSSDSVKNEQANFWHASLKIWSHRLTVRTSGSHPDNPGSIPGEITIEKASGIYVWGLFYKRIY